MTGSIHRPWIPVWAAVLAILALSAPWTFDYLATYTKPSLSWYSMILTTNPFRSSSSAQTGGIFRSYPSDSSGSSEEEKATAPFVCDPNHAYTTTLISLDPLLLYITSFLSPSEIAALLASGAPDFAPSYVVKNGRRIGTPDRTSQSAGLSRDDPAVRCVLSRAQAFLGTALFDETRDDIGPPQLVRYEPGQRYNVHHDWYETPQPPARGEMDEWRGSGWNRVASFFAILEDGCEGGETWFPRVEPPPGLLATHRDNHKKEKDEGEMKEDGKAAATPPPIWRIHEDGGVAFRPVAGNALFWVNLYANGTGDRRTLHAGLPVDDGLKTAMNIWPRKYYK
ncbi:prolyl 4-hydroxylase 6 [Apiospora sp. TS-2023a]